MSCNYQGHEFGASYPDSLCIEGFLWDADSCEKPGGPLYIGGEIPCPKCNHENWLEYHRESTLDDGYVAASERKNLQDCPWPTKAILNPNPEYPERAKEDGEKLHQWWVEGFRLFEKEAQPTKSQA